MSPNRAEVYHRCPGASRVRIARERSVLSYPHFRPRPLFATKWQSVRRGTRNHSQRNTTARGTDTIIIISIIIILLLLSPKLHGIRVIVTHYLGSIRFFPIVTRWPFYCRRCIVRNLDARAENSIETPRWPSENCVPRILAFRIHQVAGGKLCTSSPI